MTELHWNLGWTLATLGVCWLALSCAVALAIGQIIKRSKASAEVEVLPFAQAAAAAVYDVAAQLDDEGLSTQGFGSRAASGMRLKAVALDQDLDQPARRVS